MQLSFSPSLSLYLVHPIFFADPLFLSLSSSLSSFFSYSLVPPLSCSPFILFFLSYLSLATTLYFSLFHSLFLYPLLFCLLFLFFNLFLSIVSSPSHLFSLLHSLPHSPTLSLFHSPYFFFTFFILGFTP